MDDAEFYRLRDDRTNQCVQERDYRAKRVHIAIDEQSALSYSGQLAFLLAVNLTARWCRRICIEAPSTSVDLRLSHIFSNAPSDLLQLACAVARSADPFGHFDDVRDDGDWICLHVGYGLSRPGVFRVVGAGWLALAGHHVSSFGTTADTTPVGAALAACVGVAWAFRRAQGDSSLPQSVRLSLWNLRGGDAAVDGPPVSDVNLGNVALIGCGAVGSSIAYLLPLLDIRAEVALVDKDIVDVTSLNRSPLFMFRDCGALKCVTVAEYLARSGLRSDAVPMWFDDAVSQAKVFHRRPDIVISAANEYGVRHAIQHQVPPLQIYGTTGRDWQAFLGRHIPLVEDCLACRFPNQAHTQEPPLACATGPLIAPRAPSDQRDAALPFLSTAAAVLGVAEMLKATTSAFPVNANFACVDFRGPLEDFFVEQRLATAGCTCESQQRVWTRLNGYTRFSRTTPVAEGGR